MKRFHRVALAAALVLGSSSSFAALQTLTGSTFSVTYDDTLVGLFGTPSLVGNSLQWFPSGSPGFSAEQGVAGIDLTNSTFALMVTALPGYTLSGFNLTEGGDYFAYAGAGSAASVAVGGQLRVTPSGSSTVVSAITPTAGFTTSSTFDLVTTNWTATASVAPLVGEVTMANVSIQNLLGARVAGVDGLAFIEKKEVFLNIGTAAVVPEPETYALLLAGLGVIGFLSRRRSQSGY